MIKEKDTLFSAATSEPLDMVPYPFSGTNGNKEIKVNTETINYERQIKLTKKSISQN